MQNYRLGIDIGGTFTDFCLMNETTGVLTSVKVPSTPSHPTRSVVEGIRIFSERYGIPASAIGYFVHGTTIAVNTVIERKGARSGLVVTKGFRDVLNLGRSRLPDIFDFSTEKPEPLIARRDVREIDERMLKSGTVYRPLPEEALVRAVQELVDDGVEALTISFLHSYRNSAHELRAKELVRSHFPALYVSVSSEIWPQIREYERTLVTAINTYVGRKMDAYFGSLEKEVAAAGVSAKLLSTKSNGGIMTALSARQVPVETLTSGPASGVIGARYVGNQAGFAKIIGIDMGGTSTEVAVVDGDIRYSTESHVGDFDIIMPAVDVSSIGAGGGSIAWTDASGVLKVGPRSAGAEPGPACYGRGGSAPTITDAYVVMGIVDPEKFLGGELKLDAGRAAAAIDSIATVLGLDRIKTAEAIVQVATSNMYSELVPLMARKGVDVSEFALLVYGGAGATHGFMLAREVGIQKVFVPLSPGTLCALGSMVADVKSDFIATVHQAMDPAADAAELAEVREAFAKLAERASAWIRSERINVSEERLAMGADIRYLGQSFEIAVDLSQIDLMRDDAARQVAQAFHKGYEAIYGQADRTAPIEIINVRVTAIGITAKPPLAPISDRELSGAERNAIPSSRRRIYFDGKTLDTAVFDRSMLTWGHQFSGPAIIDQYDTTVFIPEGFKATVDRLGNVIGELQ
ncbi:MAG: hydantoinase/oxoprolinase family protein [Betaproteobacteria bacterium]|nr:hydantoinase/oxoprolinase family protein [Betaproteobacteria bacterium]